MYQNLSIDDRKLENAVNYLPNAGGKRLRPVLLILSAESVSNIKYDNIVPVAAGFEALHTSSLIQDDHPSMDNHNMRRGVKTLHKEYDSAISVLSSDILRSKATTWCTRIDRPKHVMESIIEEFDKTVSQMCIGQKMDLQFERENRDVSVDEYIDMVSKKTAQIYSSSAKCGVIASQSSKQNIEKFERFGKLLGIGFQMIDDILDIQGEITGKDSSSDVENNKRTIVTIRAQNQGKPIFSDSYNTEEKIDMIEDSDSIPYAQETAEEYIDKAINEINDIKTEKQDSYDALMEIAEKTKRRRH
jgi:geranylgeranyl diphosphate synthase type I